MMKKILLYITTFLSSISFGQTGNDNSPYNVIPPSPESFYKSQFGNTDINDFKGEPIVNIPLFSLQNGNIPLGLDLKYIKAGVKVNDIPNSTGINWVLNAGGIITRTINDIADEKVVRNLIIQPPNISMSNPGDWGAYVLQTKDHETDVFNFTVGNYSGSFFLDQNFQPVILTKDNNCKVEVVGSFSQNYEFKITTNDGIVYHFGGAGFTEKTFNKEQASTAGVTSFYLKQITSNTTNSTVNFEYENIGVLRSVATDIQENFNTGMTVVDAPACGGYPVPSSDIEVKNSFLKISDPKRIKKITSDDKIITFEYSNDFVLHNKLSNINISINNTLLKKFAFTYLDKFDFSNHLQRYFLTNIKFYENNNFTQEYVMDYDNPLALPDRLSKAIDYLGYYNGQSPSTTTLIPNINLFENTNIPGFDLFADRRSVFEFAKYGSLISITYPTKGKTIFEYEPISEGPKDDKLGLYLDTTKYTDSSDLLPYEYLGGGALYTFKLNSFDQNINTPTIKARAVFKVLDELNNVVYTSTQLTVSKATPNLSASTDGQFSLDHTKKYKFLFEINDNLCSNCEGIVEIKLKRLSTENGPGVRLKKQYDITENQIVNIKRMYYTDYNNISNRKKNNVIFIPDFKSKFLLYTSMPNPNSGPGCNTKPTDPPYPGSSSLVDNIRSTPYLNSLEYFGLTDPDLEGNNYFNLNDPMYSNITISFGGDNFEKGGEEKKYYIKNRSGIGFDLFYPDFSQLGIDQLVLKTEGILNGLIESTRRKFRRSYSFPNVDGKLLSDKIFKIQNNTVSYIRTSENTYNFTEDRKAYNILGTDVYPSRIGGPYDIKNKFVTTFPTTVDEALLSETVTTDYPNPNNQGDKIVKNTKSYYSLPHNQLTKQSVTHLDGPIVETTYQYAYEKNNQRLIDANMIGIPLETKVLEKQNATDAGKAISRSETKYDNSVNLFPSSVISYDVLNNTPSTEISYDWYDGKGNLLQYTVKNGLPVTIVWGYNNTQPIAKIEGIGYRSLLSVAQSVVTQIITASDSDAANPTTEPALITALDNFRKNADLSAYQITTYTYDPLIGVTSITPPSGIREVYIYDTLNRLMEIRQDSKTGKLVKEFKYHYKN